MSLAYEGSCGLRRGPRGPCPSRVGRSPGPPATPDPWYPRLYVILSPRDTPLLSCFYKRKTAKVRGDPFQEGRGRLAGCPVEAPRAWAPRPSSEGGLPGPSPKMPADPPTPWPRFPPTAAVRTNVCRLTAELGACHTRSLTHRKRRCPRGRGGCSIHGGAQSRQGTFRKVKGGPGGEAAAPGASADGSDIQACGQTPDPRSQRPL